MLLHEVHEVRDTIETAHRKIGRTEGNLAHVKQMKYDLMKAVLKEALTVTNKMTSQDGKRLRSLIEATLEAEQL